MAAHLVGYEWQLRKSAAGAKKGLGRVEKLLKPDVPTPKVKPKVKPKVTAPTPKADVVPDLPLETVPRGKLPAGHVDTPGTPTQFGGTPSRAATSDAAASAGATPAKTRASTSDAAASSDAARFAAATAPPKPNPQIDALTASISKIQKRTSAGTLSPEWIAAKQKLDGAHADRFWAEFTAGTKNPAKLRLDQEKVMMKNIITQGSKTPDQDGYGLFRMFAGPDRPDKMSAFRVMAQKAGYQMGEFKFNPSTSTAYAKLVPPKGKIR